MIPAHVVSLNLCADQLLLALADRRQIAGVTVYAADPGMSAAASAARGLPTTRGTAEELLLARPDLIIAAPYQVAAKRALLPGTRIVAVPEANDAGRIAANVRTVAAALGHPDRANPIVASLSARLPPLPRAKGPVIAQYQRGGWLAGTGTLVDDLIRRTGGRNLATVLHRPPLSRMSLEAIIAARPDFLLTERRTTTGDRGAALLDHPALARAFPPARRLVLDGTLTVCGGPAYPRAVAALRAQITGSVRSR
ncbi:MAG: ABC transporter substrate-binding protein [Sphingomonadaceae bacterium]|nr:ABC transporter substrate-binding protein [Sphingomonadaceae bacterium]